MTAADSYANNRHRPHSGGVGGGATERCRNLHAVLAHDEQATDDLMLALVIRATFPGPDEVRCPCSTVYEGDLHKDVGQRAWAFWTASNPEEELEKRRQVQRLLGAWWDQYRLSDGGELV